MKNLSKKTRTKIEDLTATHHVVERKPLSDNELRQISGGLPMEFLSPCSCTQCGDEDCD